MKTIKELPGFLGVREFFRRLGPDFEPVRIGKDEARRLKAKITVVWGEPWDYVKIAAWSWAATARVLEARRYPGGITMVRFGARQVDVETLSLEKDEMQLLFAFDGHGRAKHYSLMYGRGLVEDVGLKMSGHDFAAKNAGLDEWQLAEGFIHGMRDDEFFVIQDRRTPQQFFQAIAGSADEVYGRLYHVEYCLVDYAWQFAATSCLSANEVVDLVHVLRDGGFLALQDATEWEQMHLARYWETNKKIALVDEWLTSLGMAADAAGNAAIAEKCRKAMSLKEPGSKPLMVPVTHCAPECEVDQVIYHAESSEEYTEAERARMMAYGELAKSIEGMTSDFKNKQKGKQQ